MQDAHVLQVLVAILAAALVLSWLARRLRAPGPVVLLGGPLVRQGAAMRDPAGRTRGTLEQ